MATPLCYTIIIPFFTALLLVGWIHPRLVKIALLKNIVDNPDARKLQRTPVPVLGGTLFLCLCLMIAEEKISDPGKKSLVVLGIIAVSSICDCE